MKDKSKIKTPPETLYEWLNERDEEDLRTLLKLPYGRRFVWRFLSKCGVFMQSLVPGETDSTAFNEGRRSIGLTLLKQVIDINPEAYLQMTKEAKKEEEYGRSRYERKSEPESAD
jgi:hypothetical protein